MGEVLKVLRDFGIVENILVVFSSDNGFVVKGGGKIGGFRGYKVIIYEGGVKVLIFVWWLGKIKLV